VLKGILVEDPAAIVIVITGYATISSAVESIQEGAYDFLPKPFAPDELRVITRRALERTRLLKESAGLRREKERLQEKFIAMVSHQLRSPLVAVRQYHEVLLEGLAGNVTDEQREILERSQYRLNELLSLVKDWLSFSRLEENSIRDNSEKFKLQTLLEELKELLQPSAEQKQIRLILPVDDTTFLYADRKMLKEALFNCLSNAIQYNREGGEVSVHISREEGSISVRIRDTGVGIPSKDQARIFDEFFRCRQSDDIPGTGLGLAIVKRIIELHGGSVSVLSREGEGSEFTLLLPDLGSRA
jgi:signal transduction histidine kinase